MILGYYAPLPPAPSGIADYALVMLQALQRHGEVRVNADGDVNIYHIGNNRMHAGIYARAIRQPGVVILHDAVLQHLFLGMSTEESYVAEFVHNYGEWNRPWAHNLWSRRARAMSDPQYYRFPMLRRLVESSRLVIVHSEETRHIVRQHSADAKVAVIPHLALETGTECILHSPDARIRRDKFRSQTLQLQPEERLLGVYGYLRESKRLHVVLRVFQRLRNAGRPVRLLVAGTFASEDYERSVGPMLRNTTGTISFGASDAKTFRMLLSAADICVNLRYPSAGESSGIAARAASMGVPLVMSEGMGGLPENVFAPVAVGPGEEHSLQQVLEWMLDHPASRRRLAQAAWRYAETHMETGAISRSIWSLVTGIQ
jgi:glycosyltransferase involved in cell wall biosynthesis